jgi:D-sedoheptulose 7-phosphate isomerase
MPMLTWATLMLISGPARRGRARRHVHAGQGYYHERVGPADAVIDAIFEEHLAVAAETRSALRSGISQLATQISESLAAGGKLLVFGNGGSAADAQHLAAELMGRFRRERGALAAIALTTDSSALTAIANDFAFEEVFARQVQGLCRPGDVVVGISTSGNAANVARGVTAARQLGARTWGLTGRRGGRLAEAAEWCLQVPSDVTARIQEMHVLVIHAVSELVDAAATEVDAAAGSAHP